MTELFVTAFRGHELLAAGPLRDVAHAAWRAMKGAGPYHESVLIFEDLTGKVIDLEGSRAVATTLGVACCATRRCAGRVAKVG